MRVHVFPYHLTAVKNLTTLEKLNYMLSCSALLVFFLLIALPSESNAGTRFIVKDKVIIDTKAKIVWTRNANIPNKHVTWQEALQIIKDMNNKKYAGYNNWELPSDRDFDQSFDHRRYRRDMESFNARKLRTIGFKNVKNYYYMGADTFTYPRGAVVTQMTNPIKGSDVPGDYGYLWPISRMTK